MKDKILWTTIGILLLVGIFNAYSNYQLSGEIQKLSDQLSSAPKYTPSTISAQQPSEGTATVEKTIPIVAVSNDGEGVVGKLTVKLIPGNNNVLINTNPFLDTDIQYSANKAVAVAKLRSNYSFDRDFLFDYSAGNAQLIGGESAGAASAVATIAALQGKTIRDDTAITGTIESDGTIGEVGSIIEKAKAVADAGYKRFLIPLGQANVTYYERQISEEPTNFGFRIRNMRYVPMTLDLKKIAEQEWNLEIVETSNIDDALKKLTG